MSDYVNIDIVKALAYLSGPWTSVTRRAMLGSAPCLRSRQRSLSRAAQTPALSSSRLRRPVRQRRLRLAGRCLPRPPRPAHPRRQRSLSMICSLRQTATSDASRLYVPDPPPTKKVPLVLYFHPAGARHPARSSRPASMTSPGARDSSLLSRSRPARTGTSPSPRERPTLTSTSDTSPRWSTNSSPTFRSILIGYSLPASRWAP